MTTAYDVRIEEEKTIVALTGVHPIVSGDARPCYLMNPALNTRFSTEDLLVQVNYTTPAGAPRTRYYSLIDGVLTISSPIESTRGCLRYSATVRRAYSQKYNEIFLSTSPDRESFYNRCTDEQQLQLIAKGFEF